MGVQRIPNGSVHYASGTLETLWTRSRIEVARTEGQTEREREREREREKDRVGEKA